MLIVINAFRENKLRKTYNKRSRDLPELEKGQTVFYEHKKDEMWRKGKIEEKLNDRSYLVKDQNGAVYRRNRVHMRPTKVNIQMRDQSPPRITMSSPNRVQPSLTNDMNIEPPAELNLPPQNELQPEQPAEQVSVQTPEARPKRITREPTYLKDYVRY